MLFSAIVAALCLRCSTLVDSGHNHILLALDDAAGFPGGDGNQYTPRPLETSLISLGDNILKLTDALAENSHEIWARERIAQGWKWGPVRDEMKKLHPA